MNTLTQRILMLVAALVFLSPAVRTEQAQKGSRASQEDRLKKLEERADAAEKTASSAAMERDYITRIQKQYESYYQKVLNTQMWTVTIMGLILTGVFVLVARFSLKMIEEQTKTATAGATVQMRNEFARALAKEVQKLWDANATDIKKLKEGLTAHIAGLEQNLKNRSDFQAAFVQGFAGVFEERHADTVLYFRKALSAYKSGKPRNLMETEVGATALRYIFELLRKVHADNYMEKAREELADPLYSGLEEELALAALRSPWLTPLANERPPAPPAPVVLEPVVPQRPVATAPEMVSTESDLPVGEESDSCRLINT